MKKIILPILTALSLTACAGVHKKVAVGIVVATDQVADDFADAWHEQVDARIDECREKAPKDADSTWRRECIGEYSPDATDKAIAAVETTIAVQLAVKAAAECEELKACLDETDWKALAAQASAAWNALKPFVQITKSKAASE